MRHLQADSHLITWLHRKGIDYDIITDDELDRDGFHAIKNYQAIMTGSHPEYFTESMLNALLNYRESGGNLIYLGGNGFYWRIARHLEDPSLLEIRRAEDGIRAGHQNLVSTTMLLMENMEGYGGETLGPRKSL